MEELQAASAVGQGKLYRVYDELLQARGVPSAQVLLTFFDMSARTHYLNARHTLRKLLDWRVVPVINENDTTTTDEISFGDNDFLAAQVAILLGADRLVLLTDTGGLYTADPRRDADARADRRRSRDLERARGLRHRRVHLAARLGRHALEGGGGRDGHRGRHPGDDHERRGRATRWPRALAGEPRRHALPSPGRAACRASSSGSSTPSRPRAGSTVDEGAERALRERGTSLLPVGVVDVEGEFEAGDAVEVRCDGRAIGKGIVNYSAEELRRIKGLKTDEVRELLPRATEEAVHRDYFVLE